MVLHITVFIVGYMDYVCIVYNMYVGYWEYQDLRYIKINYIKKL